MARSIQPPRMSRLDVEDLARAHGALDSVQGMLATARFPARDAVSQMVAQADAVICRLFNKAEKLMLSQAAEEKAKVPSDAPTGASAGESADQPEIAAPAQPEPSGG